MEKDWTEVGAMTPLKRFNIALAEKRLDYDRKHLPFDEPCARLEFRDKLEEAEKESERRFGFIKLDEIKLDFGDLDKYGNPDVFEFVEEQPHLQDKVIEGVRTQVLTGYQRTYRCKKRGHGISVFVPAEDYNKTKDSVIKKKKEE